MGRQRRPLRSDSPHVQMMHRLDAIGRTERRAYSRYVDVGRCRVEQNPGRVAEQSPGGHDDQRGDTGVRSFASVQGGLVMYPILTYGSEDQKRRWLPRLQSGEAVGRRVAAFGEASRRGDDRFAR